MSMWGMNDGLTLTGDGDFASGANTFVSGNGATTWLTELEVGDCVIGADTFLYRITAITAAGAATLDRNYSGTSATDQSVVRVQLPRHIKITTDAGAGMTPQDLGIFGISGAERSAGVDNLTSVGEVLVDLMAAKGWGGAESWSYGADEIAPTIVGGSLKHGGPDLGPVRARQAWSKLGVDGLGIANSAPDSNFEGDPRLTIRMVALLQGFPECLLTLDMYSCPQ